MSSDKILPPGLSGRSGMTLIIFTALATVIFFIPEIMTLSGIQSGVDTRQKKVDEKIEKVEEKLNVESKLQARNTPEPRHRERNKIIPKPEVQILTVDEYQQEELKGLLSKIHKDVVQLETEYISGDPVDVPLNRKEVYELFNEARSKGGVEWKLFRNTAVQKVLEDVERQLSTLVKRVDYRRYPASNRALVGYLVALQGIISGEAKIIDVDWYLQILEENDKLVTKNLVEEGVHSELYQIWLELSLFPLIGSNSDRFKLANQPPFRGDLILTVMKMREASRQSSIPDYKFEISGVVLGEDSERVKIYRNRRLVSQMKLGNKGEVRRFSFAFSTPVVSSEPKFTVRVIDKEGRWIAKDYKLVERAKRFPIRAGIYNVPDADWDGRNINTISRRLDNYFRMGKGYGNGLVEGDLKAARASEGVPGMIPFNAVNGGNGLKAGNYSKF